MFLRLDADLGSKFPGLHAILTTMNDVKITSHNPELEKFKTQVFDETKKKWNIDDLKDNSVFRYYRDFFWKVKVDPTKTRPASEALVRRILRGNPLPTINTLVDAYNIASVTTTIPFGAFDADKINGVPIMREASPREEFHGIGMDNPLQLSGGEAVIQDDERLVAVYPYRDAEYSKVTTNTRNLVLLTCGVPGIGIAELENAEAVCVAYIARFCGGVPSR